MQITRRSALLGTAAAMSFAAPVAMAEYLNRAAAREPLKDLWREYEQVTALHAGICHRADVALEVGNHEGCSRLEDEATEFDIEFVLHGAEREICMADARTIKGAVIQARLLLSYVDETGMEDAQDAQLARNLLAGLERLDGGAAS